MKIDNKCMIFLINYLIIINLCSAEIKLIQVVVRHADRNPQSGEYVDIYDPNDPDKNEDWKPDGPMELNNIGKSNAYKLGNFFRENYGNLFGLKYMYDLVYFQSADMTRSINTAQLIAAGLFPPMSSEIWNPNLLWTPVPIHVTHLMEDTLFYSLLMCENYKTDRLQSEEEVKRLFSVLSEMQKFLNYLTLHTGVNHTSSIQGWMLYHQLVAKTGIGLELESWTKGIFPDGKLKDISAVEYVLQTYTMRMKRLVGGVWIKKFLDYCDRFMNNEKMQKGFFFAGNEIQVAGILNTLGVYQAHVPGYASAVIFELHELNNEFYVKIVYKDGETPIDLQIPGCDSPLCPLSTFKAVLRNVTLENFEEDCGRKIDLWMIS